MLRNNPLTYCTGCGRLVCQRQPDPWGEIMKSIRAICLMGALALCAGVRSGHADVILSQPQFTDADSFDLFVELTAPLDDPLLAVELVVATSGPATLSVLSKLPAVPGVDENALPNQVTIFYLNPVVLPVGNLFQLSFNGASAAATDVDVTFTVYPDFIIGPEPDPIAFARSVQVTAVPEPETWALFTGGLALVALRRVVRRRFAQQSMQANA